ncbi:MAG: hypothetical protein KKF68_00500 [Nanoarchaeota archaeon]|nr:hypothetical protein [Nanoarchaeota archaeon]
MKIKEVKVELVDKESRFVMKKIITDKGEFTNRKLSVSNGIYSCERKRLNHGKSVFNSPFQTFHINWDNKEEEWEFKGLKKATEHSEKYDRIFIPYKQRNEKQWNNLNWKEAKTDFQELKLKSKIIQYCIPLTASLDEWKIKRKEAIESLEENQKLIPIFSSKHLNIDEFQKLIKYELKNSELIGICSYGISNILERTNLSIINSINSSFNVGDNISLIVYLDYNKILTNHSYIAGSFAYCCFAGDIFSEKAYFPRMMSPESVEKMMNKKASDYFLYDIKEKKFTKSLSQKEWHGFSLTDNFMDNISVSEGLNSYDSIRWINHYLQQRDLNLINKILLSKRNVIETMKNYSGWNVFINKVNPISNEIQRTL